MTTLQERITSRLKSLSMSAAELARRTGISPPSISLWCNGTTKELKGSSLMKAAKALEVRPAWLQKGEGPMLAEDTAQQTYKAPTHIANHRSFSETAWPFLLSRSQYDTMPATERERIDAFISSTFEQWRNHQRKSAGTARKAN